MSKGSINGADQVRTVARDWRKTKGPLRHDGPPPEGYGPMKRKDRRALAESRAPSTWSRPLPK